MFCGGQALAVCLNGTIVLEGLAPHAHTNFCLEGLFNGGHSEVSGEWIETPNDHKKGPINACHGLGDN